MKKAAIYIRVSSDKQAQEGDSIAAQRDALMKYVVEHGMKFAGEYLDDGISGTRADRDELQRLLADVGEGKVDLILVTKLDRLYRNIRHYLNMMDTLDKYGVGWLAIWEPIYDTTTPSGRLIVNQMMSIAQFEAENTGQRIRQVQAYKVTQGEVITGITPAGYDIVNKHLVPNGLAPAVLLAFQTYARTGNLTQTIREMEGYGLTPHKAGFKRILKNEKYIGRYRGNPNYCPPIVPKELFDDVQRKLNINVKSSQKYDYIFAGLLVCAHCGKRLGANTRRKTRKGYQSIERTYRCPYAYLPVRKCDNRKVCTEHAMEQRMLARIRPEIEKVILEAEVQREKPKDNSKRLKALERKVQRLKELYLADMITMDEYKADRENLQAEIDALNEEKAAVRDLGQLRALLDSGIEGIYLDLTNAEKRYFWRSIIKEIRFEDSTHFEIIFL